MITRLRLDNYACLSDLELRPGQVNLVTGRNGSGKTMIALALDAVYEFIRAGTLADELFSSHLCPVWNERTDQRFELDLALSGGRYAYVLRIERDGIEGPVRRVAEALRKDDELIYLSRGGKAAWMQADGAMPQPWAPTRPSSLLPGLLQNGWSFGRPFLESVRRAAWYSMYSPEPYDEHEGEEEVLDTWAMNFSSWYRYVVRTRTRALEGFFEDLREALPGAYAFGTASRPDELRLFYRDPVGTGAVPMRLEMLSQGELKIIVLYAILHMLVEPGAILWFDEPVAGVYQPEARRWLRKLGDKARAVGAQVFVATQHTEAAEELQPDTIIALDRPGGGPVRARIGPA